MTNKGNNGRVFDVVESVQRINEQIKQLEQALKLAKSRKQKMINADEFYKEN